MRHLKKFLIGAALLALSAPVMAAENGLMIRAGDLLSAPFIDAAKGPKVKAKQKVTILERRGAWMRVEANGESGWVRSLNVRLEEGPGRPRGTSASAAALRTGSTGRTVTTGVKGLDEQDFATASPSYAQLAALNLLPVTEADAKSTAGKKGLKELQLGYFDEEGKPEEEDD